MNQTSENNKKPSFGADFCPFCPNLGHQFFFFKNLTPSVSRYHGQLSSCTISEKTNDPILRKLSDRQTDKPNESDFIRHCPMSKKVTKDISLKLILTILKCYTNWALICHSYPTERKLKTMKSCAHLICTTTKTTSYI